MKTFHHEQLTGHTAANLEEIPAVIYNGLGCSYRSLKSQLIALFHHKVWPGRKTSILKVWPMRRRNVKIKPLNVHNFKY